MYLQQLILAAAGLFFIQLPPGSRNPDDNSPIDLSEPFDVIVYIVLPIILFILYFLWRRHQKRNR